tara:strand:- start:15628 stop:16065 length:438 start_codon:yes stop_codon:yes gene_type:complete
MMVNTSTAIGRHNNVVTWGIILAFMFTMMVSFASPTLSQIESRVFPVTSKINVVRSKTMGDDLLIWVEFEKKRQCDFLGMVWYKDAKRLIIDLEPGAATSFPTRPTGPQSIGPWKLYDVTSLHGVTASTFHRCNNFWTTLTSVYP